MRKPRYKYFMVMQVAKYKPTFEQWFIHFTFWSTYHNEDDCSKHDEDLWNTFWKLKNVSYRKICDGHFASPSSWNYIRLAADVNMNGLHLGKWMNHSPFHRDGWWQSNRKDI